jgi:diguanylate cyclase (GGDEF)-like protein
MNPSIENTQSTSDARHLELLKEAQRIARIGSWERDLRTNHLWWSDECFLLFGFEPSTTQPTYALFLQQVHPEDRELINQAFADSFADGSPFALDFRVVLPRGNLRYYHMQGRMFFEGRHEPVRTSGTIQDVTQIKLAEQRFNQLAHHDALTGLPNRLSLLSRLEQALPEADRYRWMTAVIFIDLDRFKVINDTLGHPVGDQLLVEVARRLTASVRASDTVARLGGDEFVVVLPDSGGLAEVAQVARKILDAFVPTIGIGPHELHTSPSLGIAVYPADGADPESLMKHADTAMYHAKSAGRNTFQFYAEEMNQASMVRMNLEHSLRQAVARGEFALHYQPQVDALSKRIIGVEALIRWETKEFGFVPPNVFIPVAEESGLISGIGNWVLREACRQMQIWRLQGLQDICVAVNVSARQLRQRGFVETVQEALADSGMPAHLLELEITESVLMERPQESVVTLNRLRDMGVSLAIDDFGTGYSSLTYLKLLPIHNLKIDRSFVADLGHDMNDRAIAFATIALAHTMGLKVVAEGVETEEQFLLLQGNGCNSVQGYLFSRPLPPELALEFLRQGVL